jgi:hypothetical protein
MEDLFREAEWSESLLSWDSRQGHELYSALDLCLSRDQLRALDHVVKLGWASRSLFTKGVYHYPTFFPPKGLERKTTRITSWKIKFMTDVLIKHHGINWSVKSKAPLSKRWGGRHKHRPSL